MDRVIADVDSIQLHIDTPSITLSTGQDGSAFISTEDVETSDEIQWLGQVGQPRLPYYVTTLLLPPDADLSTVAAQLDQAEYEIIGGQWTVAPHNPPASRHGDREIVQWRADRAIVDGRDVEVYSSAEFWPDHDALLLSTGRMRQWRLAQVAVPLLKYKPQLQLLRELHAGQLTVTFERLLDISSDPANADEWSDPVAMRTISRLVGNYTQQSPAYVTLAAQHASKFNGSTNRGGNGYVIITTDAINTASTQLANFVTHKQNLGYTVQVITEADFGGGSGDAASENIRAWLQDNYVSEQIEYALLIGDVNPSTGDVPMKMLWPAATGGHETPSDYYYADLTGDWDLDNDGYYGEYDGDFGTGGIDRFAEVLVGRIPYYGDITELDAILAKTIAYESDPDPIWRRNVLLPMRPSDMDTPGYHLGEAIKDDLLVVKNWPYHRLYDDDFGLIPPPETVPCTQENVTDVWSNGTFGLVAWWTHGGITFADGVMSTGGAADLNDAYPSFTFQASCGNAYPEQANNLAYALLKNGGVVTIGGSRVSWYIVGQVLFPGSPSNAGMAYEYVARVVGARATCGFALHDIKERLYPYQMEFWKNYLTFNIYGDPSLHMLSLEQRRYVDALAPAGGDGAGWDTAYTDLQDALADVPVEIWVAGGTYKPDRDSGDRSYSFQLVNGVEIYGGFAGDETTVFQRDPMANKTILSGDLNEDDDPNFANLTDNSYHVVTGRNTDATAILDGFVISGGAANYSSNDDGGGLYLEVSGCPTIRNCIFENNVAKYGAAVYCNSNSNPTFVNCVFRGNQADVYGSGYGGAMSLNYLSSPTLVNCLVIANRAASSGGGLYYRTNTVPTLTNCVFYANHSNNGGGVYGNNSYSDFFVTNCIFWANTRYIWGEGDVADEQGQIMNSHGIDINNTCLQNWSGTLGGVGNFGDNPQIVDPDGADDLLATDDDDFTLSTDSPCVDTGDNAALPAWLLTDLAGDPRIQNEIVDLGVYEQTPVTAIPGDIDGDGDVDLSDLAELLGSYGLCDGDTGYNPDADLDGSGCVNLSDLAELLGNYGEGT